MAGPLIEKKGQDFDSGRKTGQWYRVASLTLRLCLGGNRGCPELP